MIFESKNFYFSYFVDWLIFNCIKIKIIFAYSAIGPVQWDPSCSISAGNKWTLKNEVCKIANKAFDKCVYFVFTQSFCNTHFWITLFNDLLVTALVTQRRKICKKKKKIWGCRELEKGEPDTKRQKNSNKESNFLFTSVFHCSRYNRSL
jgi:hypothetical protein